MTTASDKTKAVVYVDVEDDITGIIERIRAADRKIVALVLPKRFGTLQSIVNMKLLKRAGERSKKHIVLITSDASLLPLAGSAGILVAKSLQSKPEVPTPPAHMPDGAADDALAASIEPSLDKTKPIGQLAAAEDDESPIELDNDMPEPAVMAPAGKTKKDKKLRIPNFNKFRTWLIVGGVALVVLVGGGIWAFIVLPKADVVIKTNSTSVAASREITLLTADNAQLDADEGELPAERVEAKRTQRQEVAATGEKNKGKTAQGGVTMTAKNCSTTATPSDVPAGTGVSANGKTYVTRETASFAFDSFTDGCLTFNSGSVKIAAQNPGADFNVDSADFAVAGRSNVDATGSAKGGTDEIVKIVTQADIDKAKQQITAQQTDEITKELKEDLEDQGLLAVETTFATSTSGTQASAKPNEEAEKVTVTEEVTYTMLGIKREDLEKIVAASVADKIDTSKQAISDYGLGEATFTLQNQQNGQALVGIRSVVTAGPDLDVDAIKQAIAGKKASEANDIIKQNPGVTDTTITYGPFWVRSIPGKTAKIYVTIEEPTPVENTESPEGDSLQEEPAN